MRIPQILLMYGFFTSTLNHQVGGISKELGRKGKQMDAWPDVTGSYEQRIGARQS